MANGKKTVAIELNDGTSKFLADLTTTDLQSVKLTTGQKKGQPATWLTLKSEVTKETPTHKTERRLFKWTTMPTTRMYDITYAKDLETFAKEVGKQTCYNHALGNYLIDQDKAHNGVTGGKPADEKLISQAEKLGLPAAVIEQMKKAMKDAGFGK